MKQVISVRLEQSTTDRLKNTLNATYDHTGGGGY